MIFILIVGIIGELVAFVLVALSHDALSALLVAPAGGILAALAAGLLLSLKK